MYGWAHRRDFIVNVKMGDTTVDNAVAAALGKLRSMTNSGNAAMIIEHAKTLPEELEAVVICDVVRQFPDAGDSQEFKNWATRKGLL